jgi:hypothetical protein
MKSVAMDKIADRNSWKALPLPTQRAKLPVERTFTEQDYRRLAHGLVPKVMEDKWFIFMENDVLFFQRSWTGVCIYEVHFDNQRAISDVWVNRDAQQYKETDNQYDKQLLSFLIDNLLLGQSTPFPMSSNIPGNLPKGVIQHSVSGTGYPEEQYDKKETWTTKAKRIFKRKGK